MRFLEGCIRVNQHRIKNLRESNLLLKLNFSVAQQRINLRDQGFEASKQRERDEVLNSFAIGLLCTLSKFLHNFHFATPFDMMRLAWKVLQMPT